MSLRRSHCLADAFWSCVFLVTNNQLPKVTRCSQTRRSQIADTGCCGWVQERRHRNPESLRSFFQKCSFLQRVISDVAEFCEQSARGWPRHRHFPCFLAVQDRQQVFDSHSLSISVLLTQPRILSGAALEGVVEHSRKPSVFPSQSDFGVRLSTPGLTAWRRNLTGASENAQSLGVNK